MKRMIYAGAAVLAVLLVLTGCGPAGGQTAEEAAAEALASYTDALGHVRILGDIDHVLKGEPVDDEPGVTVQSMVAGTIAFDETKTELAIPLTLTKYDFDGHRNPEDPTPEKYTRIATGTLTLVLKGAVNAEGTGFVATGYEAKDVALTLSVDKTVYILLDLPDVALEADALTGIFTTQGGVARSQLTVTLDAGKAVGIADLTTPKFGAAEGAATVNGTEIQL